MPTDLLSLLNSERRLLAQLYRAPDRSLGLPRPQALRAVNQDESRLARLIEAGVLQAEGERYLLRPTVAALLAQLLGDASPPTVAPLEALRTALAQGASGSVIRQHLRTLQAQAPTQAGLALLRDHPGWPAALAEAETALLRDRLLGDWHRALASVAPSPLEEQSPLLLHLAALEEVAAQGELLARTNLATLLADAPSLWLDGKITFNLRPDLEAVAALLPLRPTQGSAAKVSVPEAEVQPQAPDPPSWQAWRQAFLRADTDLLSFLQTVSDEPAAVAELFRQALAQDGPRLRVEADHIAWAGRRWARVIWQG